MKPRIKMMAPSILGRLIFHLNWRISQLVKTEYCPVNLPWFAFNDRSSNIDEIHYLALKLIARKESKIAIIFFSFFWTLMSTIRAFISTFIYGGYVDRHYKINRWQQFFEQIILAHRYNIEPSSYYKFDLFESFNKKKANLFIQHHEIIALLPQLNKKFNLEEIDDQLWFLENAITNNLPLVRLVASFREGNISRWYEGMEGQLPRTDLVAKPTYIYCGSDFQWHYGMGLQRWHYDSNTDTWSSDQQKLTETELIGEYKILSRDTPYLLQFCVPNHSKLKLIAGQGVCTVRAVTVYQPEHGTSLLYATLRMPKGNSFIDNFAVGGLIASINLTDGVLGVAVSKDIRLGIFENHPDSKSPILGYQLPYWQETFKLAITAQNYFSNFPFVGWDIIITDSGPMLLKANTTWCADLFQMSHNTALGETAFPKLYLEKWKSSQDQALRAEIIL